MTILDIDLDFFLNDVCPLAEAGERPALEGHEPWEEARVRRALLRDRLQAAKTERAVYSLPSPRRRRLLEARYLQGMSWQEIAGLFSLSESTLYALHRAALKELEERMFPG